MTAIFRRFFAFLSVFLMGWVFHAPSMADTIAIIGTGNVAGALGPEFAAQGHDIVYGSRDPAREEVVALVERTGGNASAAPQAEAVVGADIVVLAVPGGVAEEVAGSLGDLSGKIILDPTNRISGAMTVSLTTPWRLPMRNWSRPPRLELSWSRHSIP